MFSVFNALPFLDERSCSPGSRTPDMSTPGRSPDASTGGRSRGLLRLIGHFVQHYPPPPCRRSSGSPPLLVLVAEPDRDRVHRQQDPHQHDDRSRREGRELLLLGVRDPPEDLDRKRLELARRSRRRSRSRTRRRRSGSGERSRRSRARGRGSFPSRCPGMAAGRTCFQIVCHWVAPSAIEPSRIDGGTARSASRPAMITTGSTSRPSVRPPASTTRPSESGPRTRNARPRIP